MIFNAGNVGVGATVGVRGAATSVATSVTDSTAVVAMGRAKRGAMTRIYTITPITAKVITAKRMIKTFSRARLRRIVNPPRRFCFAPPAEGASNVTPITSIPKSARISGGSAPNNAKPRFAILLFGFNLRTEFKQKIRSRSDSTTELIHNQASSFFWS